VPILNGLTFAITPGQNVGIVSASGGGKSTISSLLLRFYNLGSGKITIDNKDIQSMNITQLRRQIGVVSQEPGKLSPRAQQ